MNDCIVMIDNLHIKGSCGRTANMKGEVSRIIFENSQEKYFSRCLFESVEIFINNKNIKKPFVKCCFMGCEIHMNGAADLNNFQNCNFDENTIFVEYIDSEKICSHYVNGELKALGRV